jgi:hypothetical protein
MEIPTAAGTNCPNLPLHVLWASLRIEGGIDKKIPRLFLLNKTSTSKIRQVSVSLTRLPHFNPRFLLLMAVGAIPANHTVL